MSGKKCPPDKEDQVRCLVVKDALELLGCVESGTNATVAEETKAEEDKLEKFFAQIDDRDIERQPLKKQAKPLIVLDVQNIAMRHGKDKVFSCRGI